MAVSEVQHTTVYRQQGRFAGWPANYGMWSWGDEIVTVFTEGTFLAGVVGHKRDTSKPFTTMIARSMDGGATWQVKPLQLPGAWSDGLSADEHQIPALQTASSQEELAPVPVPDGVDFTSGELALLCGRTGLNAGAMSWFYLSRDRCRNWSGPHELPRFDLPGVAARTDLTVLGPRHAILMLTGVKRDGREGIVFCSETRDGGKSFRLKSVVGPEPAGYRIMPATVKLAGGRLLTAVRCHGGKGSSKPFGWIDLYSSEDTGASWQYQGTPVDYTGSGNPPAIILLPDTSIWLIYGYRDEPYGIRAKNSTDGGATWSDTLILRDDAGDGDIGYPRVVQRADGSLVTTYYYNDAPDTERYIAATIWRV